MKRDFWSCLAILALISGCGATRPAVSTVASTVGASSALPIFGKELYELSASGHYRLDEKGQVVQRSPLSLEDGVKHYKVTAYISAGAANPSFVVYATYLDEEDGGNTYGWINDMTGHTVASISDSFIEPIHQGTALPTGSEALAPQSLRLPLKVSDTQAVNTFLTSLVEQHEQKQVNPTAHGDAHLAIYLDEQSSPCKALRPDGLYSCHVEYQQNRWNGVMDAILQVQAGQALRLTSVQFGGSY